MTQRPAAGSPTTESESLSALLLRCADGDRIAFRRLYELESPRLYGLALRLTRHPQLAADAMHDAFLQVWKRAASFDPLRGVAEAWLATVLRYRAIDIMRRRAREVDTAEFPEVADEDPNALDLLSTRDESSALRRCLEGLDAAQRRVVTLAFLDGLSHAELATKLAAPLGTVKSWVRRALQNLRRCLEP